MPNVIDLTGQIFGRLTVLRRVENDKHGKAHWLCVCSCGKKVTPSTADLRSGNTKSCNCLQKETVIKTFTTHNMHHSPEYEIWSSLKKRCLNPRTPCFHNYGGRGIAICKRWETSFNQFYADMGPRPTPKHTLDRRDNDGHYSCGECRECLKNGWVANCRWATRREQCNNTRHNHFMTFQGRTQTLAMWAQETGINQRTLSSRLNRDGWSIERSLMKRPG